MEDDAGSTALKVLRRRYITLSLGALEKLFRKKEVKKNGKRIQKIEILRRGDILTVFSLPENIQTGREERRVFCPPYKTLEILFEDEGILAINKPSGIAVHGGSGESYGIIDMVKQQWKTAHLCHRLDKETSGVLLVAKQGETLRKLLASLQEQEWEKKYCCLVFGKMKEKKGTINLALERQSHGEKMKVGRGKKAITHYEVEKEFAETSFLRVLLETGRTHQIRCHFTAIDHPLVLDRQHGDFQKNRTFRTMHGLRRLFLHAEYLTFSHPESGKEIALHAPLPADLVNALSRLS